ncbi:MAG: acyl-CoA dehydrogenase family protein [Gammaproteobacteria bacterium]|nr:acyl-CoA dehydrogenase family protein [Gammaproteobacteria bacterium]
MLRETVRAFAENEIRPQLPQAELEQRFPLPLLKQMGDLGLLGVNGPEAYGGGGLGMVEAVIVTEEIGRISIGFSSGMLVAGYIKPGAIWAVGTDEQKAKYVTPALRGESITAFGASEASAGNDIRGIRTVARDMGDHFVINGHKTFNTMGPVASSEIILAYLERDEEKARPMVFLMVDTDTPGVAIVRVRKHAFKCSDMGEVFLSDVKVPKENLLGDETGAARGELMRIFDGERILVAARSIGLAQAAYELALKQVGVREQFGRPIGEFQGTGFKLAEMLSEIKAARLLTYAAASYYDQQVEHKLDTAAAKLFAIQVAERCASACLQIHGGWGLIEGVNDEVVRNFMDSRVSLVTTGSVEVQKQIICRLLGVM